MTSGTTQNYSWTYDRWGNRWAETLTAGSSGSSWSASFNTANNHILGTPYDAAGNTTSTGGNTFTYDADGNIIQVGTGTATYVYDAMNRRVSVAKASGTNEFIYDYAGRRISTWIASSNTGSEGRIYWDGKQIAFRSLDGTTYFEQQNWIGAERVRTNYAGTAVAAYVSLPYGDGASQIVSATGQNQDNTGFALLELDTETNTEHAQYRQYGHYAGRWQSPDPYSGSYDFTNPQSLNRYGYVTNNPLMFNDPSGQDPCSQPEYNGIPCIYENPPLPPDLGLPSAGSTDWLGPIADAVNAVIHLFFRYHPQFQGSLQPRPKEPENSTKAQIQQQCLNQFNSSGYGKAVNFFSPLSMFLGPEPLSSFLETTLGGGSKYLAVSAGEAAGQASLTSLAGTTSVASPLNSLAGSAAELTEASAKVIGPPVVGGAASLQVLGHAGCAAVAAQVTGQMSPLPPGEEVSF